jgi:phosphoribosylaminoimidazolecarboxamide formyltransferase/IMP cyclohydrolase
MRLRYGMNPHQEPATAEPIDPRHPPLSIRHGEPSMINLLDALNAWALVSEAARACGKVTATSFKHVSPAGAALAGPLDTVTRDAFSVGDSDPGPAASAYLRARDADPRASYGDVIAVSAPVDAELAELVRRLPSDGIVAPGYEPGTVATLATKKNGRYLVLEADPDHEPTLVESRDVGGFRLTQPRDTAAIDRATLTGAAAAAGTTLPGRAATDLLLGLVVLRYTQSNSVAFLRDGMALGIGAGQQSRIDSTRLAGAKTDTWWLRRHPQLQSLTFRSSVRPSERTNWRLRVLEGDLDEREPAALATTLLSGDPTPLDGHARNAWLARLDDVSMASDGALPFRDNVDRAARHGVRHIAEPGGSIRSHDVELACRQHHITHVTDGLPRLFDH